MKHRIIFLIPFCLCFVSGDCNDECKPYMPSSSPGIEFYNVPPIGSEDNLSGRVKGVHPDQYGLAVFIYVPNISPQGWWNKPYFDKPMTTIKCNSDFDCDITTGGRDPTATKIRVYILPKNYNIPRVEGSIIPDSLEVQSRAWVEVVR